MTEPWHGTAAGAQTHQRRLEPPCAACAAAKRDYEAAYRSGPAAKARARKRVAARNRAISQLRVNHMPEYRALYKAEKERGGER